MTAMSDDDDYNDNDGYDDDGRQRWRRLTAPVPIDGALSTWVTPPTTGVIKIKRGGDENITINHGCGGDDCGGGSNSSGDDGGDGGNGGNGGNGGDDGDGGDGGGRKNDGGVGCGRADDDGDDEDDDGSYDRGKSNNFTTVTGTVAMGLAVWARVVGDETGIGDSGKSTRCQH